MIILQKVYDHFTVYLQRIKIFIQDRMLHMTVYFSFHDLRLYHQIGRSRPGGISSLKPGQIRWISALKRGCLFHLNL